MNSKPFHWRNRTSFFQATQIASNLHYHYYASFSSRIPTFKKTSYWQGSVLHINSNPLLREVAGEAPKDDRLAPPRLLSCSEHTNFQSKPKKLGSPLKHQVPKFQIRKYPFSEKDKKNPNYQSAAWAFKKWGNSIHVDLLLPKFISFLSL